MSSIPKTGYLMKYYTLIRVRNQTHNLQVENRVIPNYADEVINAAL